MNPRLSILVCALASRQARSAPLLAELTRQTAGRDDVEVVWHADGGELTVGRKRQLLLERARGEYACFVDDDDRVSPRYVEGLVAALAASPDCVALWGEMRDPLGSRRMLMSHANRQPGDHIARPCCHLNPVRRGAALAVGFANMSAGEDVDYAHRLGWHLRREAVADPALATYHYDYDPAASATLANPDGVLYRNRFGGNFTFRAVLRMRANGLPRVRVNGSALTLNSRQPPGRRVGVSVTRYGPVVACTVDGRDVGSVDAGGPVVAVELPAGDAALVSVGPATVDGRRVVLRYQRKSTRQPGRKAVGRVVGQAAPVGPVAGEAEGPAPASGAD